MNDPPSDPTTDSPDRGERRAGDGAVARAVATVAARLRSVRDRVASDTASDGEGWTRVWLTRSEARWRAGDEVIECFRFGDGFVATVEYVDRDVTWQLTAGPAALPCGLTTVALYVEHGITPQIDPDGRPFVGIGADGPRQVFERSPSDPVEYVYLDTLRTFEEVPDAIDLSAFETAADRLDARSHHRLRSDSE